MWSKVSSLSNSIKKLPNSNKTTAAWEQPSGYEWHLLKQPGMSTSVQRQTNGLKCLSMDDQRKHNIGKLFPPRKQAKSEPGTGVRHWRGRNTEKETKMMLSKNTAPTSLGWKASLEKEENLLLMAEDDMSLGQERKGKQKSLWQIKTTKQKRLVGELIFKKCKKDCSKIRDNTNLVKGELFWIKNKTTDAEPAIWCCTIKKPISPCLRQC